MWKPFTLNSFKLETIFGMQLPSPLSPDVDSMGAFPVGMVLMWKSQLPSKNKCL